MTIWRVSDLKQKLMVEVRVKSGGTNELEVLDIGEGGCMVDCKRWSAEPGERALVTLPGLSAQPAEIVWVEDERAGLAFETALHEAVLENLWQRLSAPA
ncbi:PilZ domain-containing protein [Alteraurantiacibacter aquimixticola]|nr:PilZ domain-containing protein [Alteraurantiacibacter aquimixticola]